MDKIITIITTFLQCIKNFLYTLFIPEKNDVSIQSFNPEAKQSADKLIRLIRSINPNLEPLLYGSVAFEICGVNDIDIFIPCDPFYLKSSSKMLSHRFGPPIKIRRNFHKWVFTADGFPVELKLISRTTSEFMAQKRVFAFLMKNRPVLKEYERLKIASVGSNSYRYNLTKEIFFLKMDLGYALDLMRGVVSLQKRGLPLEIGEFSLLKRLPNRYSAPFQRSGIYISPHGKKVYAKAWYGPKIGTLYGQFVNEIRCYKMLASIDAPPKNNSAKSPKFVGETKTADVHVLLIEYADAKQISHLPTADQADAIVTALNWLTRIDVDGTSKSYLMCRNPEYWLTMGLLSAGAALFRFPSTWRLVIDAASIVMANFRCILTDRRNAFIHRDLGPRNIMKNHDITVIDFQLASWTHPFIEDAVVLLKVWNSPDIRQQLIHSAYYRNKYRTRVSRRLLYLYALIFGLYEYGFVRHDTGRNCREFIEHYVIQEKMV